MKLRLAAATLTGLLTVAAPLPGNPPPQAPPADLHDAFVVIPPWSRRLKEGIDEGGHQPWRENETFMAGVELGQWVPDLDILGGCDDDSFQTLETGEDSKGRPTVILRYRSPYLNSWRGFEEPEVFVWMFQNHRVWITTRIEVREGKR